VLIQEKDLKDGLNIYSCIALGYDKLKRGVKRQGEMQRL
jgi:hypothetical protein